ncbi:hypothetical protein [Luminiphilus syltensis]|uniref:hypothetical protein n=1 Tax=Luminiphilus syltensis TaxID=1341119 RepID=UPI00058C99D6|nr:hypothetical protein [Luminiphilus syltensis]
MEWLDRPLGPMRIRAWGLLANMMANALALYGLSQVLSNQGGHVLLAVGFTLSVLFIALLAVPSE